MVGHVTTSAGTPLRRLPGWVTLVRAPNPGPMTLDGTNTWVVRSPGDGWCVVVDPGPLDEAHLAAVAAQGPVAAILVTHHHHDHVDGLARLVEMLGGVPVLAGADAHLDAHVHAHLDGHGLDLTVLPTPGHTADSVCFLVTAGGERAVLTGDTILGRGTTMVAHPDGDLGDYLDSLGRLERLGPVAVLPGHGPALADCSTAARFYLGHRLARLDQVRRARDGGARTAADIVATVYADTDRALWGAAELSVGAALSYLDGQPSRGGRPGVVPP